MFAEAQPQLTRKEEHHMLVLLFLCLTADGSSQFVQM